MRSCPLFELSSGEPANYLCFRVFEQRLNCLPCAIPGIVTAGEMTRFSCTFDLVFVCSQQAELAQLHKLLQPSWIRRRSAGVPDFERAGHQPARRPEFLQVSFKCPNQVRVRPAPINSDKSQLREIILWANTRVAKPSEIPVAVRQLFLYAFRHMGWDEGTSQKLLICLQTHPSNPLAPLFLWDRKVRRSWPLRHEEKRIERLSCEARQSINLNCCARLCRDWSSSLCDRCF